MGVYIYNYERTSVYTLVCIQMYTHAFMCNAYVTWTAQYAYLGKHRLKTQLIPKSR